MSDTELLELSRRATNAARAMRLAVPDGCAYFYEGMPDVTVNVGRFNIPPHRREIREFPATFERYTFAVIDLRDPLTRTGALPLLVRDAFQHPQMQCWPARTSPDSEWWVMDNTGDLRPKAKGATEEEAWVAALEAAASRRKGGPDDG